MTSVKAEEGAVRLSRLAAAWKTKAHKKRLTASHAREALAPFLDGDHGQFDWWDHMGEFIA